MIKGAFPNVTQAIIKLYFVRPSALGRLSLWLYAGMLCQHLAMHSFTPEDFEGDENGPGAIAALLVIYELEIVDGYVKNPHRTVYHLMPFPTAWSDVMLECRKRES